jgi:hypothetical protein
MHIIEWDSDKLAALLAQLRAERQSHDIDVSVITAEAGHNALMARAEAIKRQTEIDMSV